MTKHELGTTEWFRFGGPRKGRGGAPPPPPPAAPSANFVGSPVSGTAPLTVTFADQSTGNPTSWAWQKNPGTGFVNFAGTPTAQNPSETFSTGTYDIKLTASNTNGSTSFTRSGYVVAQTPGVLTPSNFTLIGGYRVPVQNIGDSSTQFSLGGLYKDTGLNEYIVAGPASVLGNPMRLGIAGSMGTGSDPNAWPLLTYNGLVSGLASPDLGTGNPNWFVSGAKFGSNYFASSKCLYATTTPDFTGPGLYRDDGTSYSPAGGNRQVFDGFLGDVPSNFFSTVGSNRKWMGAGGYISGQGSSAGPSLLVFDPASPGVGHPTIFFGSFGSNDPSVNQQRPATYNNAIYNSLTPNYWQADRVRGLCWTPYGLVVMAVFGEGNLVYGYQTETFGTTVRLYMGVITNSQISTAFANGGGPAGAIQVGAWTPWLYDYAGSGGPSDVAVGVFGCWYDATNNYMHVLTTYTWTSGGQNFPSVFVYQITPPT